MATEKEKEKEERKDIDPNHKPKIESEEGKKTKKKDSKAAETVNTLLSGMGLTLYEKEKRFPGCRDTRELPFDFMIVVSGRIGVIEIDGIQHFEQSSKFHKKADSFSKQQRHDKIKNRFTRDHNISLLRIAYDVESTVQKYVIIFIEAMRKSQTRIDMFSSPLLYFDPYDDKKNKYSCLVM